MSLVDSTRSPVLEDVFASIFPLPLTTFESFMVADNRADYPMMCDIEVQFQGSLDRRAFDAALTFAIARNPLMTARIEWQRGGWVWIPTPQLPPVDFAPLGTPLDDSYTECVDLTRQPGLRIWVRQGSEQSTVLLHFHHACADGIGTFGFIEDLLAGYAAAFPDAPPVVPRELRPDRLLSRGEVGLAGRSLYRRIADTIAGAREGARFFLQAPVPLAATRSGSDAVDRPPVRPGFHTAVLPQSVVASLRRLAATVGATLNDVLLRDLFLVLRSWNAAHGSRADRRRLRILMPQNLREREDRFLPAANMLSFAFVTRKARFCDRPEDLLDSIREETAAVRRGRLSLYFTGGLAAVQSAGVLRWLLQGPFCFATAVLTNLSEPMRRFAGQFPQTAQGLLVGNVVYLGITGIPPVRRRTRAVFGIFNNPNRFTINLKWDPRSYSALDAEQLLAEYIAQLHATAESVAAETRQTVATPCTL